MRTPSQHSSTEARDARVGFVTLHGMGQLDERYSEPLVRPVVATLTPKELGAVTFNSVFYQRELQHNETKLWDGRRKGTVSIGNVRASSSFFPWLTPSASKRTRKGLVTASGLEL